MSRIQRVSKAIASRLANDREEAAKSLISNLTPEERLQVLLTITK